MFHLDQIDIIIPCFHSDRVCGNLKAEYSLENGLLKTEHKFHLPTQMKGSGDSSIQVSTVDAFVDFFEPKKDEPLSFQLEKCYPYLPLDYADAVLMKKEIPLQYKNKHFFIRIRGNLVKYFQGHSLYGSLDTYGLAIDFILKLLQEFKISPLSADIQKWKHGLIMLKGFHVCCLLDLKTPQQVDNFILSMIRSGSLNGVGFVQDWKDARKKEGFGFRVDNSMQIYKYSGYNKFFDLLQNTVASPNFETDHMNALIINEAYGKLRLELKCFTGYLRRNNISTLLDLLKCKDDISSHLIKYTNKIEVGRTNMNSSNLERLKAKLPNHLKAVYLLWLEGQSVVRIKEILGGGKRTKAGDLKYARASISLRKDYNINIKVNTNSKTFIEHDTNVIPLIQVLEAEPTKCPQWMKDEGLIHEPSQYLLNSVKK